MTDQPTPALLDLQFRSLGIAHLKSANHTSIARESLKFLSPRVYVILFLTPRNRKSNNMDKTEAWHGLLVWILKLPKVLNTY